MTTPAALTERHRQAQARLGAKTMARLVQVWPLLDPLALDATATAWLSAASGIVLVAHADSATLAAAYYAAARSLSVDEDESPSAPVLPALVAPAAVETSLLVTGPVRIKSAVARGERVERAVRIAKTVSSAAGQRHALAGGRDTLLAAVRDDPQCLGYARVTSGKGCAFCRMLASRGPVYGERSGRFESHPGCSCTAQPSFSNEENWPGGSERDRDIWDEVTRGLSGADALNAFRRHLAG